MAETSGNTALSPGNAPGGHAACDAVFTRMKGRAEAAEVKLSAIAERLARVPIRGAYLTPEQELTEDLLDIITGKEGPQS